MRRRLPPVPLGDALVLVTGAGSGIGRATATAFASQGARVVCVDLDGERATATLESCRAAGGRDGAAYAVDVADRVAMMALADEVTRDHGTLDVLVNNAGVGMTGHFLDTGLDDWDWILSINLLGVVHGCHAFGPAMLRRGAGHVVNIASALAYTPRATEPAYVATKAAVLALSRSLRADWHRHGVGVTAVCPGVIDTAIIAATRFMGARADDREKTERLFAKGHKPEVVGRAIVGTVQRDRAVHPVGIEAWIGWFAHRLVPQRAHDVIARATLDGV